MSLKHFHLVFVSVCGLLCVWVAGWALGNWGRSPDAPALLTFGALGFAGLAVYLRWFLGKLKSGGFGPRAAALAVPALAWAPADSWACSVCFGVGDTNVVRAFNWGIVFMAVVTFVTLGGLAAMMLRAIREKEAGHAAVPQR